MKNTDPHQKACSSNPPAMTPSAPPAPAKPAQMAIALPRSALENTAVMIESVAGIVRAAPTPMIEREAMRLSGVPACVANRAPAAKSVRPTSSARLRPKRSPSAPAGSSSPAKTKAYEATIHNSSVFEGDRASRMLGRARFRELTPATTRMRLMHITPRMTQRRGCPSVEIGSVMV